jgi:2,4-dienoyl-CoA reductase-like NADH-dependent reductase (Old Yellow Enzyme family)
MSTQYKFLEPYTFAGKHVTAPNRIAMAPMTTKASFYDGQVTNDEVEYYRMRSGVGLLITGVANVDDDGKGFEGELSVADDRYIPGLSKIANAVHEKGSLAVLQIFSAGRKTTRAILCGKQPYSASAIARQRDPENVPRELSGDEVEQLVAAFGEATRRAIEAGFDGVEIHGANSYLIQQFFSPQSNRRTDKWGGDVKERMSFPLAVIASVTDAVAAAGRTDDFIIGYRLSPEELSEPGITITDTLQLVDVLSEQPIDYLHTSMGDYRRTSLRDRSDTEEINKKVLRVINGRKPLIEVGSIERPEQAEDAIDRGATFAALGRELIREPQWVEKVKAGEEKSIRYTLSPVEMDVLGIPSGFQTSLRTEFINSMNFTDQMTEEYLDKAAPMEGM